MFGIRVYGQQEVKSAHDINVGGMIEDTVSTLARDLRTEATTRLRKKIYGQPPSPHYIRTGKALRSIFAESKAYHHWEVEGNTMRSGADRNYLPFLNKNSRVSRLNSLFWDDSNEWIAEEADTITSKISKKYLK